MKKFVCVVGQMNKQNDVTGKVTFIESKNEVIIKGNITGLTPGYHGFHIHEYGDLSEGCSSLCKHFDNGKHQHGGPNDNNRHIGDLGNIYANKQGVANFKKIDKQNFNFSEGFNPYKVQTNREKYVIANQFDVFEGIYKKND